MTPAEGAFRFAIGDRVVVINTWPKGTIGRVEARFFNEERRRYVVSYRIEKVAGVHHQVVTETQLQKAYKEEE